MVNDIRDSKRSSSSVDDNPKDDPIIIRPSSNEDKDTPFIPPETIAHEEEVIDMASLVDNTGDQANTQNSKPNEKLKGSKLKIVGMATVWVQSAKGWWNARSKKQKIIIAAVSGLVIILLALSSFLLLSKSAPPPKSAPVVQKIEEKKEPPKPTTEASKLTGVQVNPEYNLLPVTGIMIENSPDARPQSGLYDAGVVFEAIAEGGITRFLALYQEAQPDYVGPVRSVRPYYLQWLQGFDAAVGHVGGSGEALAKIRNEGIKDLDQSFNGGPFQRVSQRYAPHNVYTSLGALIALGKTKGYTNSTFTSFTRKAEKPVAAPNAKTIDLAISSPLYNVRYSYDGGTNSYARSEGGLPHKDERSGKQLSPKVVIAIVLPQGIHPDRVHTTYNTIGSGTAFIFQDSGVTVGMWSKGADKEQIRFGDANGAPLAINAGQTWITAVSSAQAVTYVP